MSVLASMVAGFDREGAPNSMREMERPAIECVERNADGTYGRFVIEPLERGYGTTLGNALRRVLLSSLLGGEVDEAACAFRGLDWYADHGIRLITGAPVTQIDRENGLVIVGETHVVPFDRLVLAVGSLPIRLPKPGMDLPGVITFRDLADVAAIRAALDREGFSQTLILSYAAKFASALYGPFRDAEDSAPAFGDRRGYQLEPGNARQALREVELDIEEGADMVMVKPALAYLDVLAAVRQAVRIPLLAYNVSGEYAMVHAAAAQGWAEVVSLALEVLTAIRRAGADAIITYHALEVAAHLG